MINIVGFLALVVLHKSLGRYVKYNSVAIFGMNQNEQILVRQLHFCKYSLFTVVRAVVSQLALTVVSHFALTCPVCPQGQVDEIITTYKQYWPVLDLAMDRDLPEEEEDAKEDGDEKDSAAAKSDGASDKDKKENDKNGKDKKDDKGDKKDKKDDKGDKKDKSNDVNTFMKKKAEDKSGDKKSDGQTANDDGGNGDKKTDGDTAQTAVEDENLVDLFLDLSVADTAAGWSIYGSSESLPPTDSIMPAYFNTDQFYVEAENNGGWRDSNRRYDL